MNISPPTTTTESSPKIENVGFQNELWETITLKVNGNIDSTTGEITADVVVPFYPFWFFFFVFVTYFGAKKTIYFFMNKK
jgi:hypothetical protein